MNYYQLLGININATHEEITRAYRKEIFKNHPDRKPFMDLHFEATNDYKFMLYSPTEVYKRKYCLALNFFNSKLLYILVINKTEYDSLFKNRRTNHAVLYFNGENIKYSDKILDCYIKCIIHYN
jgi:hypothetical protein